MPRIPPSIIECVFFLYRDFDQAQKGIDPQGTGFIVQYGGGLFSSQSFFAVTNWHVACQDAPVIRINAIDGKTNIIDLGPEQWEFMPDGPDLAVTSVVLDKTLHKFSGIPLHSFISEEGPAQGGYSEKAFVGDDVFTLGMFFDHQAKEKNIPAARFGNISMLPDKEVPIKQPNGYRGESYVVDMHSRTGFSGSPVFMYRTFGSDLDQSSYSFEASDDHFSRTGLDNTGGRTELRVSGKINATPVFKFLGILWGQFPETWEVKSRKKISNSVTGYSYPPMPLTEYVEGVSGMSCVIPAWEIIKALNWPVFSQAREPDKL